MISARLGTDWLWSGRPCASPRGYLAVPRVWGWHNAHSFAGLASEGLPWCGPAEDLLFRKKGILARQSLGEVPVEDASSEASAR